jgi:hypothetical protein
MTTKLSNSKEGTEDFAPCATCRCSTLQTSTKVMLYSPGGARSILVWSCENHPTPDTLVDEVQS